MINGKNFGKKNLQQKRPEGDLFLLIQPFGQRISSLTKMLKVSLSLESDMEEMLLFFLKTGLTLLVLKFQKQQLILPTMNLA